MYELNHFAVYLKLTQHFLSTIFQYEIKSLKVWIYKKKKEMMNAGHNKYVGKRENVFLLLISLNKSDCSKTSKSIARVL